MMPAAAVLAINPVQLWNPGSKKWQQPVPDGGATRLIRLTIPPHA